MSTSSIGTLRRKEHHINITPVRPYLKVGAPRKTVLVAMICQAMLCHAMLRYAVLCYTMLCYAAL
eukprot:6591574-Pyramimonas_sp.AAC.1